ncbi:MAG: TonB-dependent receptor [Calditrichaeota bacterium]|nr:MAG: TonB-dependent receptor [Calditrichota bacterium]
MANNLLLVILIFIIHINSLLAQGTIIGRVMDEASGEGLPGANVQILHTVMGASTNLNGAFIIRHVPVGIYSLRISMIGYSSRIIPKVKVTEGDTTVVVVRLKETPIEIDPVVVTASKWQEEAENTPASVEVLTAKQIMNRNPVKIEDALKTVTGVQIIQESVNIRGSDGYTRGVGSRVLVMIDGVPVMNSDFGAVNWFMISPADVERAEIVRGAGSALYGSSAMGGVINFITRSPGPKSRTYVRAIFGVYDDPHEPQWNWAARQDRTLHFNRQDVTHSQQIGKLGLRISAGRSESTGYYQNGHFKRFNFSGKLNYRFSNTSSFTFFGNYMHDDSGVFIVWKDQDEALLVPPTEANKHQTQNGLTLFGKFNQAVSSKAAVEFRVFLNRFLLGTQFSSFQKFAPAIGLGGTFQGNFIPFPSLSIVYGSDFKFDKVESDTSLYGKRNAILVAPYVQLEWRFLKNFNLTLGGRYDRYQIYSDPNAALGEGKLYDHFSPKAGINFHPFPSTTIRASVANGFKFPLVAQLFLEFDSAGFRFLSNPNLRSEESWSYEIGFKQKITPTWFFEVAGFYTDVNNLIEPEPQLSGDVKFINIEDARIPGIEFSMLGRWFRNVLGLRANLIYMNPEDRVKKLMLPYRQKFIAFVSTSLRIRDVEFQLDYKYASAQKRYSLPGVHQLVPQKVLDGRIFFHWEPFKLFIGVNNMLNYSYTLRDRSLEEIRNFVAGFSAEL